ncbi:MAG: peptidoglycan DD-metalloendopeptidase family protein [Bacteroidales bacterium]|nr:peptidoglycan DD-metalloendopeptidase family protein [Bacteroidales bacterium]
MSKKSYIYIALVLLLATVGVVFFRYHYIPKSDEIVLEPSDTTVFEVRRLYGIPVDSFRVVESVIKKNQTLGNLLGSYNLPSGSLHQLVSVSRDSFDLRKIRAGNKCVLFLDNDSLETLRYFVYEHTPVDYNMLCFFDSVWAVKGKKPVTIVQKNISGKISSSLWNAMQDAGANPMLANNLSDIFAWSIDFFGLQAGDSFRVVCNEEFVDTLSIGYGRIHTAYFRHAGNDFYAIPFTQDSDESYFDQEGNSLRKAFLKAPLKFSRISSRFSNSRFHPVLKIHRPHHGVDYAAPSGTPVYAIGDGKITKALHGYNNGGGNMIRIRHNSVYETAYLHLKGFAKGIATGKYVKQGELIGYVGSTGLSTGPHLDFRFYKNGHAIDPLKVESPPVEPIHPENRAAFDSVKVYSLELLKK